MPFPDYFLPENPTRTPGDGGSYVTEGYGGGGSFVLKGFGFPASLIVYRTLPAAIKARFAESPIALLVPGGLSYPNASTRKRSVLPYGVIAPITETPIEGTRGVVVYNENWQASFFASEGDSEVLADIKEAWYDTFTPEDMQLNPLLWKGRRLVRFANVDSRIMDDDKDAPAAGGSASIPLVQLVIEFLVTSSPAAN